MYESIQDNYNKVNDDYVDIQKINIFGELGVGKTSFISYLENYNIPNFTIENKEIKFDVNLENQSPLVEKIRKIQNNLNEDKFLYFNIYETNLYSYDIIKNNLDILLFKTECIIIMWDSSDNETFKNIPNFVSSIESFIKQNNNNEIPIYVVQNKIDINKDKNIIKDEDFKNSFENFKKEHPYIIFKEISLFDKDTVNALIGDIDKRINCLEKNIIKDEKENDNINKIRFKYLLSDLNIENNYKIINSISCTLLGNSTVGKTTFINYLLEKKIMDTLPTIGVAKTNFLAKINNEIIYFKLTDTAGQERYNSLPATHYKNSDGILLFFDLTNKDSFNKIHDWIKNIINANGEVNKNYELFLIGNKIDQIDKRTILKKEAKDMAEHYKIKYFELSCLKGINVYEIFNEIALMAYKKYRENNKQDNKSITIKKKKSIKKKGKCC